ncbi:hypothetical protein N7492_003560 [Penicillium capsulatum]|uniref:tryptophan--tRNA ligase n=1 Tax=Penicillium capsulatum TaxID=69766 RepID=A0A9W9IKT9_9EURO|nr:hypothetical protein N7492_003560 [Penicillium capsulatum]
MLRGSTTNGVQSKLQLPEDTTLEHSEARAQLRLGLFSYPVLQAADILVHRVMSLKEPTSKMSKSHADEKSRIILTDSAKDIQKKVKVALTDSEPNITYDPVRRPGVSNLIEILSHFEDASCEEIAAEYHHASLRALKEHVGSRIAYHLQGIRERYTEIMEDKTGYLDTVAQQGAAAAQANASVTMRQVRDAMGL